MMRLLPFALLPLLAACATQPRQDACTGEFTVTNQMPRPIEQLYAGGDRDLLDPNVLAPGQTVRLVAPTPRMASLRFVFDDGQAAALNSVDLCVRPRVVVAQSGIVASPAGR
ncbi:hypothetical protein EOD42_10325 [Rhodovarius crocodyli]|uniref:Lipoprotein n=1 Tax=Rhodovarius crocodyli TaxID=1979269 RepID=A0A437MGL4_9PROT|nr:hypothetical protein [Rhodovarius crocodyli]RVT96793.1 hypothetical protein EOD42_10325 [Rhodovarius crocodyli]